MTGWRPLGETEWRGHPLNRVRGWLVLIVILLVWNGVLQGGLVLWGFAANPGIMRSVFRDDVPDWLEWAQIVVPIGGSLLLLALLFLNSPIFPAAYALGRLAAYMVAVWGSLAAGLGYSLSYVTLFQMGFIAGDLALMAYLFAGKRPNIVFRRRVRA